MVLCPVFTLLWVCAVALHSLGSTERVSQTTEPSVSRSTDPMAETVTLGPVETQSPDTHTHQSLEPDQSLVPLPSDPCQDDDMDGEMVYQRDSYGVMQLVQREDYEKTCNLSDSGLAHCLIYPTNQLNCSWKFHGLPNDRQSYASVFVCRETERISNVDCVTEAIGGQGAQGGTGNADRVVGHVSAGCQGSVDNSVTSVILTFNVSRPDVWCIYTHKYHTRDIDVLRPPTNITAWIREGVLLVQWGLPSSRFSTKPSCFHYQLQINGQVSDLEERLTYSETNADPTHSYDVRMRVRKSSYCRGSQHWSSWSNTIKVAPFESPNQLNSLVVAAIALGIPMILLSLLLLIRLQRERLFPHIPGPPLKIKHLLERDDQFQFVPQALPSKCVEEITVVEEAKETPVNMAS
ncbi:unnamed protein product [Coregonus sp. 'balchen']|nr:unnamed protein product [Coregonus sp. 'balchen']